MGILICYVSLELEVGKIAFVGCLLCAIPEQKVKAFACSRRHSPTFLAPDWARRSAAFPASVVCLCGAVSWYVSDVSIWLEVAQVTEFVFLLHSPYYACSTPAYELCELCRWELLSVSQALVFRPVTFHEFGFTCCSFSRLWPFCKTEALLIQVGWKK